MIITAANFRESPAARKLHPSRTRIPVGFSSPSKTGWPTSSGLPAFVPPEEVVGRTTPYQLAARDFAPRMPCLNVLADLKPMAMDSGICLGVWGSAGLEIYTGLPCTDPESDLDLLVAAAKYSDIIMFSRKAVSVADRHGCRLDLELDLMNGYGVKFQEVFQGADPILGKSLENVAMIPRLSIMEVCHETSTQT